MLEDGDDISIVYRMTSVVVGGVDADATKNLQKVETPLPLPLLARKPSAVPRSQGEILAHVQAPAMPMAAHGCQSLLCLGMSSPT